MAGKDTSFSAPRGTRDLLPPESVEWQAVVRRAMDLFARAGYLPVETPAFEHTEVFERGVGATSEVVGKQMYTFTDHGDRSLTLRPEATASVVRAVLEHRLDRGPLPVKLAYAGWMFRQERPQKGRYRQFFQLGIEGIGSDHPALDAEVIWTAHAFYRELGLEARLLLNSIGHLDETCRLGYLMALASYLRGREGDLAKEDRDRINTNPMRTFDSKEERTVAVMKEAPVIPDYLCDGCRTHHDEVKTYLRELDVSYEEDPSLVRGLDYYTRTAFEFTAGNLGSQNAVGGGGRYDGLAELLGGPRVPGIGFALGLDRIMLALPEGSRRAEPVTQVYVVAAGEGATAKALALAARLRSAGIGCELDLAGRSMKGQMKDADRSGARLAVIIGADEIAAGRATIKDMATGEQDTVPLEEVEGRVRQR